MVFIGLISYSLYLWHWPLFAFSTYWTLEPLSLPLRIGLTFAGLLMGILSWRFIETPFRLRRWGASRRSIFVWAGGGLTFTAVIAILMILKAGFPQRFSTGVLKFDAAKTEALRKNQITQPIGPEDALANRFPRLGAPAPAPVSLMVWGDSHACSILPAADLLGRENDIGVLTAWYPSTPPVIDFAPSPHSKSFSLGPESVEFNNSILRFISSHKMTHVLLAARWSVYFEEENDPNFRSETESFGRLLVETVRSIREAGCHPWILMEVPSHMASVPKALVLREVLNTDIARFSATPTTVELQNSRMTALIPALEAAGADIIDVSAWFIDPALGNYRMVHEGLPLYYDEHHLTRDGARHVHKCLLPLFESKTK